MKLHNRNSDDILLEAKIMDAIHASAEKQIPKFIGFLDEREALIAKAKATHQKAKFGLFGGHENAARVIFAALPDWAEADTISFPVSPITISYRKQDKLAHKDFLGTLMSLGIKREAVGDILVGEGKAVVFLLDDIKSYTLLQLDKVGGIGVTIEEGIIGALPKRCQTEEISATIASERLDCVVSSLTHLSREKSALLITSGNVTVSYVECLSVSERVTEDDTISIRSYGKYKISEISTKTKKGRIVLKAHKYI